MKKDIQDILKKLDSGELTPEETDIARLWLFQLNADKKLSTTDEELESVSADIWSGIEQALPSKAPVRRLWPRIAAAASLLVFLSAGAIIYFNSHKQHQGSELLAKNVIKPGQQGATLTLSNGKKIRLAQAANGQLAAESGIRISKSSDGQLVYKVTGLEDDTNKFNTLSTANGETYQVELPDGTHVWLNSASSLTYATKLVHEGKRTVKLTGEAYFEVVHNDTIPFEVLTPGQTVVDIGTAFNINAYADERSTRTTLVEGKASVNGKILKPDQQAMLVKGNLTIGNFFALDAVAWKDGIMVYDHTHLDEVLRQVARWYDVTIVYENETLRSETLSGTAKRTADLSVVLKTMESTGIVRFKVDGRKLIVAAQ